MLKLIRMALLGLCMCGGGMLSAQADAMLPDQDERALLREQLGCEVVDGRCTVRYSLGGKLKVFNQVITIIQKYNIRVEVVGTCASTCVLLLDAIPRRVCVAKSATLHFHQKTLDDGTVVKNVFRVPGVQEWVDKQRTLTTTGWQQGEPKEEHLEFMLKMDGTEAQKHWHACQK